MVPENDGNLTTRQARLKHLQGPPEEIPIDAQLQKAIWQIKKLDKKAKAIRACTQLDEQKAKILQE